METILDQPPVLRSVGSSWLIGLGVIPAWMIGFKVNGFLLRIPHRTHPSVFVSSFIISTLSVAIVSFNIGAFAMVADSCHSLSNYFKNGKNELRRIAFTKEEGKPMNLEITPKRGETIACTSSELKLETTEDDHKNTMLTIIHTDKDNTERKFDPIKIYSWRQDDEPVKKFYKEFNVPFSNNNHDFSNVNIPGLVPSYLKKFFKY